MNSQVSKLNTPEEENVASDDTLDEAPTINEELAKVKELTVKKEERIVSDSIKNTHKKSNITHFSALALMGEAVLGKVRQAQKKISGIPYLSPSSSNEDQNLHDFKLKSFLQNLTLFMKVLKIKRGRE